MKIMVLTLIAFVFFGKELNSQTIMYNVQEKAETELQKRLVKSKVCNSSVFESYVHNSLSITSAEMITSDSLVFVGKISISSFGAKTGVKKSGFLDRKIIGTMKKLLDSYEVTSLRIYDDDGNNNWKWFGLL